MNICVAVLVASLCGLSHAASQEDEKSVIKVISKVITEASTKGGDELAGKWKKKEDQDEEAVNALLSSVANKTVAEIEADLIKLVNISDKAKEYVDPKTSPEYKMEEENGLLKSIAQSLAEDSVVSESKEVNKAFLDQSLNKVDDKMKALAMLMEKDNQVVPDDKVKERSYGRNIYNAGAYTSSFNVAKKLTREILKTYTTTTKYASNNEDTKTVSESYSVNSENGQNGASIDDVSGSSSNTRRLNSAETRFGSDNSNFNSKSSNDLYENSNNKAIGGGHYDSSYGSSSSKRYDSSSSNTFESSSSELYDSSASNTFGSSGSKLYSSSSSNTFGGSGSKLHDSSSSNTFGSSGSKQYDRTSSNIFGGSGGRMYDRSSSNTFGSSSNNNLHDSSSSNAQGHLSTKLFDSLYHNTYGRPNNNILVTFLNGKLKNGNNFESISSGINNNKGHTIFVNNFNKGTGGYSSSSGGYQQQF